MTTQSEFSYPRYLAAKQSVDDRALNRQVFAALAQALAPHQASGSLAFLEVGCGIGTMVERLWDWEILVNADYTAVDLRPENIAAAQTPSAGFRPGKGFADPRGGKNCWHVTADRRRLCSSSGGPVSVYTFAARDTGRFRLGRPFGPRLPGPGGP